MIAVDLWAPRPDMAGIPGGETYADWKHEDAYKKLLDISATPYYANRLKLMRMSTLDAAAQVSDQSLNFVFVDADHSYEGCKADILAWTPKIASGGMIAGHDYNWGTVRRAVEDTGQVDVLADDNVWVRYV